MSSFFTVFLSGTPITSEPQKKRSESKNSGIFLPNSLSSVFVCYDFCFFLHTFRSLTVSHINGLSFAISKFSHYFVHRLLNCVHPQLYASYIDNSTMVSVSTVQPSLNEECLCTLKCLCTL